MEKNEGKREYLYTALRPAEPSPALYARIMTALREAERRAARVRLALFSLMSLLFGAALVPAVQYVLEQFAASGFYAYFSLIFSDGALLTSFWREFGLSLVESLPALALLILLPVVAAFIWAVLRGVESARVAFA